MYHCIKVILCRYNEISIRFLKIHFRLRSLSFIHENFTCAVTRSELTTAVTANSVYIPVIIFLQQSLNGHHVAQKYSAFDTLKYVHRQSASVANMTSPVGTGNRISTAIWLASMTTTRAALRRSVRWMVCDGRQSNRPHESVFNNSRSQFSFSRASEALRSDRKLSRPDVCLIATGWDGTGLTGQDEWKLNSDRTYDVETIGVTKLFLQQLKTIARTPDDGRRLEREADGKRWNGNRGH
jgi:hypothetical protein